MEDSWFWIKEVMGLTQHSNSNAIQVSEETSTYIGYGWWNLSSSLLNCYVVWKIKIYKIRMKSTENDNLELGRETKYGVFIILN